MNEQERTCQWWVDGVKCGKPSRYIPSLLLAADKSGMVLPVVLSVGFCTPHGKALDMQNAFTDSGWSEMVECAAERGLPGITRECTEIRLLELAGD